MTEWVPVIVWSLAGVGSVVFLFMAARSLRQLALARRLPTSRVGDIQKPGVYEVMGTAITPDPVVCTGHRCVWYKYARYRSRGRGGSTREWAEDDSVPFMVRDETGAIGVDPAKARVDPARLLSRREYDPGGASFFTGGWTRERLVGIEVNKPVYVAGPVVRQGGVLSFEADGSAPLVISYRSESSYRRSRLFRAVIYLLVAAAAMPAAAWYILGKFAEKAG